MEPIDSDITWGVKNLKKVPFEIINTPCDGFFSFTRPVASRTNPRANIMETVDIKTVSDVERFRYRGVWFINSLFSF